MRKPTRRAVSVTIVPKEHGERIRADVQSLTGGCGTNRYMNRILQKKPRHKSF